MRDVDGDGYGEEFPPSGVESGTDCNDSSDIVSPAVEEIYGDGIDNNCNGITDGQTSVLSAEVVYQGEDAGDRLGSIMAPVRDVDGDGHADFLVGSPDNDDAGLGAGKIYFLSGASMVDGNYEITEADLEILGALPEDQAGAPDHDGGAPAAPQPT